jgi:hypothetical protein
MAGLGFDAALTTAPSHLVEIHRFEAKRAWHAREQRPDNEAQPTQRPLPCLRHVGILTLRCSEQFLDNPPTETSFSSRR